MTVGIGGTGVQCWRRVRWNVAHASHGWPECVKPRLREGPQNNHSGSVGGADVHGQNTKHPMAVILAYRACARLNCECAGWKIPVAAGETLPRMMSLESAAVSTVVRDFASLAAVDTHFIPH